MSSQVATSVEAATRGGATTLPVWRRDRRFFSTIALLIALVVFIGFAPTYYLKSVFGSRELAPLFHLHGFLFSAWIVLLVVQTQLVARGRTGLHRRLGVAGGVLAVAMVGAGLAAAIAAARRGTPPDAIAGLPPPLVFLVIPMTDMFNFAVLVGAGLYYRSRSDIHKRLLLLGTISMLAAPIARFPVLRDVGPAAFFGGMLLFLVACVVYDRRTRGSVHRATIWGGLLIALSVPARMALGNTAAWLAFASWVTGEG